MTHNERVLALLSDGKPHSHRELYGLYVMAHSRVADLRKQGHDIRCWREGDLYFYRLLDEAECVAGEKTGADGVSPKAQGASALRFVEQVATVPPQGRPLPTAACSPTQLTLEAA